MTRVAIEDAREQVAALFGARPREVVFTSTRHRGGEHRGLGCARRVRGGGHVVTTAVEHSCGARRDRRRGADDVTVVGVDRAGRFDADEVLDAVRPDTALVSVQLANHEVGTLQPAAEVVAAAHASAACSCTSTRARRPGTSPVDFAALGADLCSVTAHKFGGPKGAGALLVRRGLRVPPFVVGGAQERARRAASRTCPRSSASAPRAADGRRSTREAARAARAHRPRSPRSTLRRGRRRRALRRSRRRALPHLVCLGVEGVEAEPILLALDQHGVAVHSGSSCS